MARAETARRMGDDRGALAILMQAVRFAPEASDLYGPLARLLTPMRFESASTAVSEVIEKALQAPWLDPQPLAPAAISALKAIHKVAANPETPIGADFDPAPEDVSQLVRQVEEKIPGEGLER